MKPATLRAYLTPPGSCHAREVVTYHPGKLSGQPVPANLSVLQHCRRSDVSVTSGRITGHNDDGTYRLEYILNGDWVHVQSQICFLEVVRYHPGKLSGWPVPANLSLLQVVRVACTG